MRLTFSVTKDDIRLGKRDDSNSCPIARSVKRSLGLKGRKAKSLEVTSAYLSVEGSDGSMAPLGSLPIGVSNFIEEFDNGETVDPFSFCINFKKEDLERAGLTVPKEE